MELHEIINKRGGKCMKKRGNLKVYKKTISLFLSGSSLFSIEKTTY